MCPSSRCSTRPSRRRRPGRRPHMPEAGVNRGSQNPRQFLNCPVRTFMKSGTKSAPSLRPRFQLSVNGDVALGPGKADLLELIDVTGSISEAASRMGMSYMRAWTLVRTMNNSFREPLVTMVRGGRSKGGSQLSDTGREVLTLYRRLESETRKTTRTLERSLIGHLRTP